MALIPKNLGAARLRAVKDMPYLATAIYALQPIETDHPALPTMAVDKHWRLYYNPNFCEELSVAETATCLIHEVNHLLRDHAGRAESSNLRPMIFNIAADCEINDDLAREHIVIPEGTIFPSDFDLEEGKLAEFYYQTIKDLFPPEDGAGSGSGASQNGGGSEQDSGSSSFQHPDPSQQPSHPMNGASGSCAYGERQPYELPAPGAGNPSDEAPGINKAEGDLIRRGVAREIENHAKTRGNVPGGLKRWAESHLKPKVNWKKELSASIRNALNMTSGAYDYTYSRPSRRRLPRVVLPSMQQPVPNVAVVIDTSGSMSGKELERAVTEVGGILKSCGKREGVSVLSVDAAVHSAKKVFSKNQIELMGGGGTDMSRGIKAAEEMKPRPDVCVVITDGYTPWPDNPPRDMKVVVVLTEDYGSVPSWAKAIKVPETENRAA